MIKRILALVVGFWALALASVSCAKSVAIKAAPLSDDQVRASVVALMKDGKRFCTAEQVVAPSGAKYLISASHCALDSIGAEFEAETEDGFRYPVKVLAEDEFSDLIILSPVKGLPALHVAKDLKERQSVRAYTRGHGFRTFKTEGVTIEVTHIEVPVKPLESLEDYKNCSRPKYRAMVYFIFEVCALSVDSMASTIFIAPGSSGGALLDAQGDIVGIATAGGDGFTYWVPISDVQRFMADK